MTGCRCGGAQDDGCMTMLPGGEIGVGGEGVGGGRGGREGAP